MQWKRFSATAFATAMLCTLAYLTPAPAQAQNVECNHAGSTLIGVSPDGKWTYFSSWTARPQFFVVKVSSGKSKQLINQGPRNPRNQITVPAPCGDVRWSPDHRKIVFCNTNTDYSLGVWMYTLASKSNDVLSAGWIDHGSSPKWTDGGNLTYLNQEGKLITFPVSKK